MNINQKPRKQKDVGEELWKTKICHGQWYKATLSQLKTMQKTNWLPQEETSQFEATPKQTRKNPQNHRGGHKQHPPKAKSHTQHPDKHGKTPNPDQKRHTRHRQSRPIDRAGRLTRAPTHKPETSKI